jgi:hypothetical protein
MRAGQGTPDTYAIFDAVTGRRLTVLPLHRGWVVRQVAWDGSDTVLAVVDADSSEAVVRFDLQGNLNRTTPVIGSAADRYRLATRP